MDVSRFSLTLNSTEAAEFLQIGRMLAVEKDTTGLLEKMIRSGMHMTDSEYGAVYLVIDQATAELPGITATLDDISLPSVADNTDSQAEPLKKTTQDRSILLAVSIGKGQDGGIMIQVRPESIQGYVLKTGRPFVTDDAYKIDPAAGIRFDRTADRQTGYRTKSVMCLPMKDRSGNVTGLIMLVNKKGQNDIVHFTQDDLILTDSIAGQATAALENIRLYRETQQLLDGYKKQNRQLEELSRRIIIAHEEERKRIAREIHDGPAQSAAGLSIKLEIVKRLLSLQDHDKLNKEIDILSKNIKSTVDEIRTIIYDLRPSNLDNGLKAALADRLSTFKESTGIRTILRFSGNDGDIPYYLSSTVYKVLQEALTNIQKHSGAKNVNVKIDISVNSIEASISDNGKGFDYASASAGTEARQHGSARNGAAKSGFGLQGIRERIEIVKGRMDVVSSQGKGTRIIFRIPLDR